MSKPTILREYADIPLMNGRTGSGGLDRVEDDEAPDLELAAPADRNRIAQWVSLVQPVLGRFHIRLVGVEEHVVRQRRDETRTDFPATFADVKMESRFIVSAALT